MNTTTIEYQRVGAGGRRAPLRVRRLTCAGLALVATAASVGALAQHVSAVVGAKAPVVVVHDTGGIRLPRPSAECTSITSGPRIELVSLRSTSGECPHAPVLV